MSKAGRMIGLRVSIGSFLDGKERSTGSEKRIVGQDVYRFVEECKQSSQGNVKHLKRTD